MKRLMKEATKPSNSMQWPFPCSPAKLMDIMFFVVMFAVLWFVMKKDYNVDILEGIGRIFPREASVLSGAGTHGTPAKGGDGD